MSLYNFNLLYELRYDYIFDGKKTKGFVYMEVPEELSGEELEQRLQSRYRVISKRIVNILLTDIILHTSQLDLENTVVPFYDKIKDKKKLTAKQFGELSRYVLELNFVINKASNTGQGYKAVVKYRDLLLKKKNKMMLKEEIKSGGGGDPKLI